MVTRLPATQGSSGRRSVRIGVRITIPVAVPPREWLTLQDQPVQRVQTTHFVGLCRLRQGELTLYSQSPSSRATVSKKACQGWVGGGVSIY